MPTALAALMNPEERARQSIDRLLAASGWAVQDFKAADLHAARGVALREFELNPGHGTADYLLYVDGKAAGIVEAKKHGATLTGVEVQSGKYAQGLPATLPAWRRPLPFLYESTGLETHFTSTLDPEPRARTVFAFHRPETLADWLGAESSVIPAQAGIHDPVAPAQAGAQVSAQEAPPPYQLGTFLHRVRTLPPLVTEWVIAYLRAHPANRPTTLKSLENHIPSMVGGTMTKEAVKALMARLVSDGVATITDKQIDYKIPKGGK